MEKTARTGLIILAAVLPVSIAGATMLAAMLIPVCLWLEFKKSPENRFSHTGWERPVMIYLCCALLAAVFGLDTVKSLIRLKKEWVISLAFLAAWSLDGENSKKCLKAFAVSSCVMAVLALFQFCLRIDSYPDSGALIIPGTLSHWPKELLHLLAMRNGRAIGTRSHPLTFAECELLAVPVSLCLWQLSSARFTRLAWLGTAVSMLAAIGASQSRGVWFSILIMMLVFCGIHIRTSKRVVFPLLFCLLFIGFILGIPILRERAFSAVIGFTKYPSNTIRVALWKESVKVYKQHIIFGVGSGNVHLTPQENPGQVSQPGVSHAWTEAHSIFLQSLTERGTVGLIALVILLSAFGKTFFRAPEPWGIFLGLGFLGLILAGITESWMNDSEVAMSMYFLGGLARSLNR